MFSEIVQAVAEKSNRALVLAHRKELIDQASDKLRLYDVRHGIIMGDDPRRRPDLPVQVASVQTLRRRKVPPADLVVIDEAHHARANTYNAILDQLPGALVLGVTATPWRTDNRPLGDLFEHAVVATTPRELVQEGHLVPVTGFAFDSPDLSGVRVTAGDYNEADLSAVMGGSKIVGNIVEQWLKHAGGVRTVLFAVNVEHSKRLVEEFRAAGVAAEHVDGTTEKSERAAILKRLECGKTTLVSNVGILTEGWDCPAVECCILARPTMSLGLYLQMVGRIRRPAGGKTSARVHDHAGCVLRHGLPDAERDYSLSPQVAKGKRAPGAFEAVRQCQNCFALFPPELESCPLCGFQNPQVKRVIEHVDGVAISFEEIERGPVEANAGTMLRDYREYQAVGRTRGYKPGWAAYRFKAKYGLWPRSEWK